MARIEADAAGGKNVVAFLDMLAFSEGTMKFGRKNGYDVLVGGTTFEDYSTHPNKVIQVNAKLRSSAAGRYQLLSRYYKFYKDALHLPDFGPESQDRIAIQQIKEQRAYRLIQEGKLKEAIDRCANIWASLPGAGYGQHEHTYERLEKAYVDAGGTLG